MYKTLFIPGVLYHNLQYKNMQLSSKDIKNDETFQEFLDARGITAKTVRKHIISMKHYCNLHQQTPTQLIEEAEIEQDNGVKRKKRKIRKKLIKYVAWLKENNRSTGTIKVYLTDIKAFYDDCEIDIPKLPKNICENKDLKLRNIAFDEIPTKEHVRKACSNTTIRNKAMILLHFSSGMGSSEVRNLKYNDFLVAVGEYLDIDETNKLNVVKIANQILKTKECIGTWKLGRYKKARPYITFNSPESNYAIANYLLYRIQENKFIFDLKDYLFVTNSNKLIEENTYIGAFEHLNKSCGFGKRKNGNNFFTSHRLRVAFGSSAKANGVDAVDIRRMLGQKGDYLDDAYLKTTAVRLKAEYMKFVRDLSIEQIEVIKYGDEEVRKIRTDLDMYKSELAREKEKQNELKAEKDKEIEMLKEENAITRKIVKDFMETMKMRE